MKEVLFVGDRPGKTNTDPAIAFDGTASGKRLEKWIKYMDIANYTKVNFFNADGSKNSYSSHSIEYFLQHKRPIIALGNNASKALNNIGIYHFKLPHPSGRNRIINDKVAVRFYLDVCKNFIEQEK